MKIIFTFLFVTILSTSLLSQTKISGKISDENNQPLPGANIYIKDTYDGASSETDGTFSFTTDEEGEFVLVVSFVGYQSHSENLVLEKKEKYLEIKLKEESTELGTVIISAGSFEAVSYTHLTLPTSDLV